MVREARRAVELGIASSEDSIGVAHKKMMAFRTKKIRK
jgi:hypothetical protein